MRPAKGERHVALARQRPISGVTVDLEDALEAGEMSDRLRRCAIGRVDIGDRRRVGSAPGPIIPRIGPELAGLGPPAPGSSTGAVVSSANSLVDDFRCARMRSWTGRRWKAARPTQSARVQRSRREPDHIAQLVDERLVFGQLELLHAMGLEPMGAPDAVHGRDADAGCFRHRRACPVRGLGRRRLHRQRHDAPGDSGVGFRDARGPRLVAQQPFKALGGEAFLQRQTQVLDLPVRLMIAFAPSPSVGSSTIRARQTCFCAALRSPIRARRRSRLATVTKKATPARIPETRTSQVHRAIPVGIQTSDFIH